MSTRKIRADYDSLAQVAQAFGEQAGETRQTTQRLRQLLEVLQGGDWIGKGANAFYREMSADVLPTMARLASALEAGERVTLQISRFMKDAEEEAARAFQLDGPSGLAGVVGGASVGAAAGAAAGDGSGAFGGGASGGEAGGLGDSGGASGGGAGAGGGFSGGGGAGGGSGGGGGGGSGGGGSASATPGPIRAANPLLVRDPNQLLSRANISRVMAAKFAGAGSPELRAAMRALARRPTGRELERILREIARVRGKPYDEIKAQYDRYLLVSAQAEANARAKGLPLPPSISGPAQDDFLGSTQQLRFGQVVGDAFGIDPVFGAMLSPTGGTTGLSNVAQVAGGDSAIASHGVVHDAAGYLYTYHNAGPGNPGSASGVG